MTQESPCHADINASVYHVSKKFTRRDVVDVQCVGTPSAECYCVFMAVLCNRAAIIFSSCGFFFPSSFYLLFLAYSQPSQIGCLRYFHTWCGFSANLECRSEMYCTRLAGNTGRKKSPKNRHLRTIAQLCRAVSSQLRHVSTIEKKAFKLQYVLHMSPQYGELRPTSG